MLGGVGAPGPPGLGAGESSAGVGRRPSASASARIRPMSAAGKASGSRSSRMAMYCAVHSPMPGRAFSAAIASSEAALGPEDQRVGGHRVGQRRQRRGARLAACRSAAKSAPASRSGVGKTWVRPSDRAAARAAARRGRATSLAARPRAGDDGDLLAEDGAHGQLEAVPGARHAQARPRGHQRRQGRVLPRCVADRDRVGGQVEHPAHPGDDRRQGADLGEAHGDGEAVARPPARRRSRPARRRCAMVRA